MSVILILERRAQRLDRPGAGQEQLRPDPAALALAVVVSHAFSVTTGVITDEPLTLSTGFTLGEHAVNGFFAISGFLVTMSFDRRGWRDYAIARTLRIAPGLIVATLAVSLLLGAAMTDAAARRIPAEPGPAPLHRRRRSRASRATSRCRACSRTTPSHFPMGTVWTLKYEVLCYAGVFAHRPRRAAAAPAWPRSPSWPGWRSVLAGLDLAAARCAQGHRDRACACR